jgi:hypothetical protein
MIKRMGGGTPAHAAAALTIQEAWKVLRARLRGRDPSKGWAGPCAAERTPSRVQRAQARATLRMKVAQPSCARSAPGLRKRASGTQLMIIIMEICWAFGRACPWIRNVWHTCTGLMFKRSWCCSWSESARGARGEPALHTSMEPSSYLSERLREGSEIRGICTTYTHPHSLHVGQILLLTCTVRRTVYCTRTTRVSSLKFTVHKS